MCVRERERKCVCFQACLTRADLDEVGRERERKEGDFLSEGVTYLSEIGGKGREGGMRL